MCFQPPRSPEGGEPCFCTTSRSSVPPASPTPSMATSQVSHAGALQGPGPCRYRRLAWNLQVLGPCRYQSRSPAGTGALQVLEPRLTTAPCLLRRNQDAGDCRFQGEDLGAAAPGCQHGKGAHAAHHGGVWHHSVPDGVQTDGRNQRYVATALWAPAAPASKSACFADYIVIGSDSGRIVILEYSPSKNMFEKIHQETFGKSGCRRIVPGQFLAVDPKGRAVMIGELFVVTLGRRWIWSLKSVQVLVVVGDVADGFGFGADPALWRLGWPSLPATAARDSK